MDSKQLIAKFKLPAYVAGKSFAEASQAIDKRFAGRNDMTSLNTKQELLSRLSEAQEFIKQLNTPPQEVASQGQQMDPQMLEGDPNAQPIPEQVEVPQGEQQFAWGGRPDIQPVSSLTAQGLTNTTIPTSSLSNPFEARAIDAGEQMEDVMKQDHANMYNTPGSSTPDTTSQGPGAGAIVGAAGTVMDLGQQVFGKARQDTSGQGASGKVSAVGTIGSSTMKGAAAGAQIGGPWGAVIGGAVGAGAGIVGLGKERKAEALNTSNFARNTNRKFSDNYAAYGGVLKYAKGGYGADGRFIKPINDDPFDEYLDANRKVAGWKLHPKPYTPTLDPSTPLSAPFQETTGEQARMEAAYLAANPKGLSTTDKLKNVAGDVGQYAKDNFGEALRYAPIATNALQYLNTKRATSVTPALLGNRYKPEVLDEARIQRELDRQTNTNINAITSSGGSDAQNRAALLGSQINALYARGNAASQVQQQNAAERSKGQQFNLGVDQANLAAKQYADEINARNQGAYDTQRSKLLGEIGTQLGEVGKEQVFKKYPELMGLKFTNKGTYITPKGEELSYEQLKAKYPNATEENLQTLAKSNKKAYGGKLDKNTIGYLNNLYSKKI
jgi:hypothetical protein